MLRVLVVDDDRKLLELLDFALTREGFSVLQAGDPSTALRLLESERPDLAVVDINLGAWSGFDLLQEMRQRSPLPIILLTGRTEEEDKVRGLELGADDYVTKPFSYRELVARARAQLRGRMLDRDWAQPQIADPHLRVGPIVMNPTEHSAAIEGRALDLTATEFRLLHFLMTQAGRVVPTRALMKEVWGYDDVGTNDVVRVTIYRLRRKLGEDPNNPRLLHTVPGIGIMLKPEIG